MPYKDPADRHRAKERALEATRFADREITTLKGLGVVHTPEEWRVVRAKLRKARLRNGTPLVETPLFSQEGAVLYEEPSVWERP